MIMKKNIIVFSTIFLTIAVLFSGQAGFMAFSETLGDENNDENSSTVAASNDDITVLGGIPPAGTLHSEGIFVVNANTGIPIYAKNEHERLPPASTTKIMTALIVLEKVADLDEIVAISSLCADEFWNKDVPNKYLEGNAAGIMPNQTNLTYRDCLYALLLSSSNYAANILAFNVGGKGGDAFDVFMKMMNDKAMELGCQNTNFTNPHGLYETRNYSTAYDMYLITQFVYERYPLFSEICATQIYQMPENSEEPYGYPVTNTNMMINSRSSDNPYYYEPVRGIKTGSMPEYYLETSPGVFDTANPVPGFTNLVSSASRNSFNYIIVSFGAPWHLRSQRLEGEEAHHYTYADHELLFKWAFNTFDYQMALSKNEPIGSIKVLDGQGIDEIKLYPQMDKDYWTLLPKELDMRSAFQYKIDVGVTEVTVPADGLPAGTVFGSIELVFANNTLGKWQLVTIESVERSQVAETREKFEGILDQWWFKPTIVLLAVMIIALIVLNFVRKNRFESVSKKKHHNRRIRR
ncbi:MAG: serine hydrolase [Oscillospiraceae bacterium]|nr:serine hydrolase [Oscillospiraceae bacterium]